MAAPSTSFSTLLALLVAGVVSAGSAPRSSAHPPVPPARPDFPIKRNVLMLNSYHQGLNWTDQLVEVFAEGFAQQNYEVDLWTEYLDTKRTSLEESEPSIANYLQWKYRNRPLDLILATDDDALAFLQRRKSSLFPNTPVVFCGVSDRQAIGRLDRSAYTGVIEEFTLAPLLATIRRLHPNARDITIVSDNSATGASILDRLRELAVGYQDVRFEYLDGRGMSLESILGRLQRLPADSVVVTTMFNYDSSGKYYPRNEAHARIAAASAGPVYSPSISALGQGLLAGNASNGSEHGAVALFKALRILAGEPVSSVPLESHGIFKMVFDYEQMKQRGIGSQQLPAGSVVVNEPPVGLSPERRVALLAAIAFILLQSAIIAVLIVNISQRRRAERELRRSQATLAAAQQIARVGNWERDMETGLIEWSDEVYRIYGLSPQSRTVTFETLAGCIHPEDRAKFEEERRAADLSGADRTMEYRIVLPDGALRHIRVLGHTETREGGRKVAVGTVQDITDIRLMEEHVRQVQKMESIGALAGGVAHDFNNLLTIINGYSQISLARMAHGDPNRARIEEVLRAGERAADLTRQLLAFGRKQVLRPTVLNLNDAVTSTQSMLRSLIGDDIDLIVRLSPDLAPIRADRNQIEQVLINLIVNARDAMPGGGTVLVETYCGSPGSSQNALPQDSCAILAVSDTGTGMDQATIGRIFEPFFTTKGIGKGTGLGLSTVYGIIKQSGGHVEVESLLSRGTTFRVYLPFAAPGAADSDEAAPQGQPSVI